MLTCITPLKEKNKTHTHVGQALLCGALESNMKKHYLLDILTRDSWIRKQSYFKFIFLKKF